MRSRMVFPAALVLAALAAACEPDRTDEAPPAAATAAMAPEPAMRATLEALVRAQAAYYSDHGRFSDSTHVLVDRYDFTPVGEATVVISFGGNQPDWAYLGVAQHPATDGRCEVQHTSEVMDPRQVVGQIVCPGV
jgi:hypothetical protein